MFDFLSPELRQLGMTPFFFQQLSDVYLEESKVGRIACERRGEYEIITADGTLRGKLSGRLEHELGADDFPTVGDWVVLEPAEPVARIQQVLERQSVLRRVGVDGTSRAQNLAANVDLCCVVCALSDGDQHARARALNPRRIERYLMTAQHSRIAALVVINKADVVAPEIGEAALEELTRALPHCRALLVSAHTARGLDELRAELPSGSSAVLLGSSGVGKSTLVNALLGQAAQRTSAERADDTRGRHTTTERQLLKLENGALLIDTPGMRELALWADAETDPSEFSDIAELALACRFRDCKHEGEPGCAVLAAVEAGTLAQERLSHAHKLERELLYQRARVEVRLRVAQQREWKVRSRASRSGAKIKGRT
ncbi:MAG TPA: ribosome small subunit-dependent GTPase A [Polyangiaceae bacterium]|nr:ribosome small subunit-dependent GTPase A [Polyangiaceae bacterium]